MATRPPCNRLDTICRTRLRHDPGASRPGALVQLQTNCAFGLQWGRARLLCTLNNPGGPREPWAHHAAGILQRRRPSYEEGFFLRLLHVKYLDEEALPALHHPQAGRLQMRM